jgi:hypothetical protein
MKYNFQKEFFLVRDDDTGTTKLFRQWWSVVNFLTDEIMKYNYHIIYDETKGISFTAMAAWRAPKNREECFNLLFNIENIRDLNSLVEDLWHIELVEFSD